MKANLLLIIFLIPICLWSQAYRTDTLIEDINQDGFIDTLFYSRDSGSNFSSNFVRLTNGNTLDQFEIVDEYCYCQLKDVVYFPPALNLPENGAFLQKIIETVFPIAEQQPDPSLQWILSCSASQEKPKDHPIFDLILNPQTAWTEENMPLPYSYKLKLDTEICNSICKTLYDVPDWFDPTQHLAYVFYRGHNHFGPSWRQGATIDSFKFVTANKKYQVYQTKHGVLVKQGPKSKWVFITDIDLTNAPGKLRWPSIERVEIQDQYLIIHQTLPPTAIYQVFVVNIESGKCGRFKFEFPDHGLARMTSFELEGDTIWLEVEEEKQAFLLEDVFEALDKHENDE